MGYSIDLKKISLHRYKEILANQNLLPGRRILLDEIEARFLRMADAGISNLLELKNSISSFQKLSSFAAKTNIPADYLVILKRELGSLEQKPIPVSDFPGLSKQTVFTLSEQNIKTSKDFYTLLLTEGEKETVSRKIGISGNELDEICCLCNLVRINGVGAAAARTIYESGYRDIAEIAAADAGDLLKRIADTNSIGHYYNAKLGKKDMQFIIDYANFLLTVEKANQ